MNKIVTILGARPQFIKAATVSKAMGETGKLEEYIIHTGQHFDDNMSKVFFDQMGIAPPNYHLGIHSLSHGAMTGRMTEQIETALIREKPDWVMVYGDTNSTLAGALAAAKLGIPVAHVEAGLRSFNRQMPEEINRILTDRISSLLFCPTPMAATNLEKEGFNGFPCRVLTTGDVMLDAALHFGNKAIKPSEINLPDRFALVTLHRQENTDNPVRLQNIIKTLNELSRELPFVFPMHPRTYKQLQNGTQEKLSENIISIPPQGYLEMLYLIQHCRLVLTDSGGLQKEAYFFKKPCITLREETEWTELVDANVNILTGSDPTLIRQAFSVFYRKAPSFSGGLYGNGQAAARIAKAFSEA